MFFPHRQSEAQPHLDRLFVQRIKRENICLTIETLDIDHERKEDYIPRWDPDV